MSSVWPGTIRGVVLAGVHQWDDSALDGALPRPLLPVVHQPLVGYSLQWLRDGGVTNDTVCANSDSRLVRQYLGDGACIGLDLAYYEDWTPRGPAGCVRDAGLAAATSADVVPRSKTWLEDRQAKLDELRRDIVTSPWQEQELIALLEPETKPGTDATGQPAVMGPRYADDADWRRLHIELKTLQHEIEANPQQLGDGHPNRIALVKKAELLEDLLKEQQDRLDEQFRVYGGKPPSPTGAASSPASELAALHRKIGLLKKQEELLLDDIRRREEEYERTFESAKVLDKENDALRYEAEKFDLVRRRIDEKETEGGMFFSVRPVAAAFAPSAPDQDRRLLLTTGALLGALAAGLGVAYVRICASPAIHELADLSATSQPPFLGNLPLLRHPERPDMREAAMQSECIRMVRTSLLQRLNGSRGSSVVVTSAGPGVGKTTVAGLLAKSLAQLGKKVLVVDADLRKPALCRTLGVPAGPGLINVLRSAGSSDGAGEARVWDEDVLVPWDPEGLDVLPAGRVARARDAECVEILRELVAESGAEVGAHLHPWENPPFMANGADVRHPTFPHELPRPVFAEKLACLTEAITDRIGPPTSYRAGRWGLVASHLRVLEDLGYEADTSVMPLVNWRTTWGIPRCEHGRGGVDYRYAPQAPYHPSYTDVTRPGTARILEVPVSVGFTRLTPPAVCRAYPALPLLVQRVLRKAELLRPVWATPAWERRDHLERMMRTAIRAGRPMVNIALHSSEFAVGGSPGACTPEKIDQLFRCTAALLQILAEEGQCEFLTLTTAARQWRQETLVPVLSASDRQGVLAR